MGIAGSRTEATRGGIGSVMTLLSPVRSKASAARLVLPACAITFICLGLLIEPTVATAGGMRADQGLRGKTEYCMECHGPSARGFVGYYTMPRLAGQSPEYIRAQLAAFADQTRGTGFYIRLAKVHALNPGLREALANYFGGLNIPSSGSVGSSAGETLYQQGAPEANVPACVACHGPVGRGTGAIPRLAGQLASYTRNQLANWTKERGQESRASDTSAVMIPIANNMSKSQIDSVAAYLSSLK